MRTDWQAINAERRAEARRKGNCPVCFRRKAEPGRARCTHCRKQQSAYCRRRWLEMKEGRGG
jgi:hypothetical protein